MKHLFIIAFALTLSACGTTSHVVDNSMFEKKQFCDTEQTIITDTDANGDVVSSKTVVQCSDKQDGMDHPLVKSGVAKKCGLFYHPMNIGGRSVWESQMSCFVGDEATGYWVVVQTPGVY